MLSLDSPKRFNLSYATFTYMRTRVPSAVLMTRRTISCSLGTALSRRLPAYQTGSRYRDIVTSNGGTLITLAHCWRQDSDAAGRLDARLGQ